MNKSYIRLLVENHSYGELVPQGEGCLDTPEKIKAYIERMRAKLSDRPKPKRRPRKNR